MVTSPATCVAFMPSSMRQYRSQPSLLIAFPSSQSSVESRTPSPQRERLQSGRHSASGDVEFCGPSSHSSPGSNVLSPQKSDTNLHLLQVYPSETSCVDCSHCSPSNDCTIPSPQIPISSKHVELHPSLSRRFVSSHSSLFSSTPFPQTDAAATRGSVTSGTPGTYIVGALRVELV